MMANSIDIFAYDDEFELSASAAKGIDGTAEHIHDYYANRSSMLMGMSNDHVAALAAGRMNWLLGYGRYNLHGIFTEWDINTMVGQFQGGLYTISEIESFVEDMTIGLSHEKDESQSIAIGQLLEKLESLDILETMALVDLLEQICNSGMAEDLSTPIQYIDQIGFPLASN